MKFLSKKEKNSSKVQNRKLSKYQLNRVRFQTLINKLDDIPEESIINELYVKFNLLKFKEKQSIRKSIKKRKTKYSFNELIEKLDSKISKKQ